MKITLKEIRKIILEELLTTKNKKIKKFLKESRMISPKSKSKEKKPLPEHGELLLQSVDQDKIKSIESADNFSEQLNRIFGQGKVLQPNDANSLKQRFEDLSDIFLGFKYNNSKLNEQYRSIKKPSFADTLTMQGLANIIFRDSFVVNYGNESKTFYLQYPDPKSWISQIYYDLIESMRHVYPREQTERGIRGAKDEYKLKFTNYALPFPREIEAEYDTFVEHLFDKNQKRLSNDYEPSGEHIGTLEATHVYHAPVYRQDKDKKGKPIHHEQKNTLGQFNTNTKRYRREGVDIYVLPTNHEDELQLKSSHIEIEIAKMLFEKFKASPKFDEKIKKLNDIANNVAIKILPGKISVEAAGKAIIDVLELSEHDPLRIKIENQFSEKFNNNTKKVSIIRKLSEAIKIIKKTVQDHAKPARMHGVFPPAIVKDYDDEGEEIETEDEFFSDVYWTGYLGYGKDRRGITANINNGNYLSSNQFMLLKQLFGLK
jgi:hypothetical protein